MERFRWPLRLVSLVGIALVVSLLTARSFADDDDKGKGKGKGKKGKGPEVVEVDLSKLPPALARELRERLKGLSSEKDMKTDGKKEKKANPKKDKKAPDQAKGKGKGKTLSLIDAVRIAESSAKGEAIKAERKTKDGVTQFRIEVLSSNGERTKITLDERGKRLAADTKDDKKEKKKGKKKE